jgi:hypothetical protein
MTRRRRPPPLGSGVSRPRVHLPGAGLALGAAIGVILGVLAGGGVAIALGLLAARPWDCSWGRPLSATGRHHQVATQLTATSALVTLARVEQWPPATIA